MRGARRAKGLSILSRHAGVRVSLADRIPHASKAACAEPPPKPGHALSRRAVLMLGVSLSIPALALLGAGRNRGTGSAAPAPFQTVNPDGWSVAASDPAAAVGQSVSVSRQGYVGIVAATITQSLRCTTRVRLPFPDQATLSADRVALSDYIYATDTIAGVANTSAEISPKPVANWALPDRVVVGNTLLAEVVAFHREARAREQVAAVEFYATDGATTVSQVVTQSVISGAVGDQVPVIVYRCDLDISTLANPATITLNARVYPHVGAVASVLDSADQSAARAFSPRVYRRDTARAAAPVLAYVAGGGNDTTGAVSTDAALAAATPCATIAGAINRLVAVNGSVDGCEIRCTAGTHVLSSAGIGSTRAQNHAHLVITRDPLVARSAVTLTCGAAATRLRLGAAGGWLTIRGVQFQRTGTTQPQGESASPLRVHFEDVAFDNAAIGAAIFGGNCDGAFFGVTFNAVTSQLLNAGTREIRAIRGCVIPAGAGGIEGWLVLGTQVSAPTGSFVRGTRSASGAILAYNYMISPSSSNGFVSIAGDDDVTGYAVVQNIVEYTSAVSGPSIRVSADSATGNTSHVIVHHNTFSGFFNNGRANLFYDDGPTARAHKLMSVRANLHSQINHKGDVFVADGTRLGGWAYLYGIGCQGEFSQFIDAQSGGIGGSFAQAYPGPDADIGTSAAARNDPLFVEYRGTASGPVAGLGGGDYRLQAASPAKGMAAALLRFDAAGLERAGLTGSGAYD